jgi:hypothetical protein
MFLAIVSGRHKSSKVGGKDLRDRGRALLADIDEAGTPLAFFLCRVRAGRLLDDVSRFRRLHGLPKFSLWAQERAAPSSLQSFATSRSGGGAGSWLDANSRAN